LVFQPIANRAHQSHLDRQTIRKQAQDPTKRDPAQLDPQLVQLVSDVWNELSDVLFQHGLFDSAA
jgi:hypothetical protein